ncbi:MAG: hypothetical protein ABSD03_17175 [Vulcanimicrobiaceae bacterium]
MRTIVGRIAALIAAVRVRERRPYAELTSWPLVASTPRSRAYATAADSCSGRSTPKLSLAATTCAPPSIKRSTAPRSASPSSARTNENCGEKTAPELTEKARKRICRRESHSKPSSNPSTPTRARSPSSNALVACVVECAINATEAEST